MFNKIILLIILVIAICVLKANKETFVNINKNKFFILQKMSTEYTMETITETTKIGYTKEYHRYLFEKVYNMFNAEGVVLNFVKLEGYSMDNVDILVYVDDSVYLSKSKYKFVNYYMKDKKYFRKHFDNFEYVVYTDNNDSIYVMVESDYQGEDIELKQSESLSNEYHFVLEYSINGKYIEVDMNTNRVILYQDNILGLEVKEDDKILLKNQRYEFMNGEYIVTKVNKYIHMEGYVNVQPKMEVCMDEDYKEYNEYSNKHSCEYKNDLTGNPKAVNMTWDARCRRNMECPFFDPDDEYSGYCDKGGYCEMPYEVKQISFTKYKKKE